MQKKKRKKPISLGHRTMTKLRSDGFMVGIVERFNSFIKIRQDLFGFIDLIAIKPSSHLSERLTKGLTIGIQVTTHSNLSSHMEKIFSDKVSPAAKNWLRAGNLIQVWGWRKLIQKNKNGNKSKLKKWECEVREITLSDFVGSDLLLMKFKKPKLQKTVQKFIKNRK